MGAFVVALFSWTLCSFVLNADLNGEQTAQCTRTQFFQCSTIWRDDEQCGVEHSLLILQFVMWLRTSLNAAQCGNVHSDWLGLSRSRIWHFSACKSKTNCCWINFCFSASPGCCCFFRKKVVLNFEILYKSWAKWRIAGSWTDCSHLS